MIQAWLAKAGARLWAYAVAIGAAVLVVFGFYQNAKRKGALEADEEHNEAEIERIDNEAVRKVENAQAQAAAEVEAIQGAKDETDKVNRLGDDAVIDELQDRWARD